MIWIDNLKIKKSDLNQISPIFQIEINFYPPCWPLSGTEAGIYKIHISYMYLSGTAE